MTEGKTQGKPQGKRGPQTDREDVKGEILSAAQQVFVENGFQRATLRRIAARAQVDPKLIHYYFGSKLDLFMHCIPSADGVAEVLAALRRFFNTPEFTGEMYVHRVLETVEQSSFGPAFLSLLRGFGDHEESRATARKFFGGEVIKLLSAQEGFEIADIERRLALIGAQMYGLVMTRYVLKYPAVANASIADLARDVGPVLDHYRSLGEYGTTKQLGKTY